MKARFRIPGLLLLSTALHAGGVVESCDEASLRTALEGGGLVTFACDGTIALTQPIVIAADTILDATGRQVTLSGQQATRVFEVGAVLLRLVHLDVAGGKADRGGALAAQGGQVILEHCVFRDNQAVGVAGGLAQPGGEGRGGAIDVIDTALSIASCLFTNNTAAGGAGGAASAGLPGGEARGGALACEGGSLSIVDSRWVDNRASGGPGGRGAVGGTGGKAIGGAIFSGAATAGLERSEIASCQAQGGAGGPSGVQVGHPGAGWAGGLHISRGVFRLSASTIAFCTAAGSPTNPSCGGGVYNVGTLNAVNTTVATNRATLSGGGGYSFGAGIYNQGVLNAEYCTLAASQGIGNGNHNGGNLHNAGGQVSLRATVIAYCIIQLDAFGTITDLGYNLCWDSSAGFTHPTSLNRVNPLLAPLADNGGPVRTMFPVVGSPVIDRITTPETLAEDARGFSRPAGQGWDIGSVEGELAPPKFTARFDPPYTQVGVPSTLRIVVENPNPFPIGSLTFSAPLSPRFLVAAAPAAVAGCDGAIVAPPGTNRIRAAFASLGAKSTCVIEVPVVSAESSVATFSILSATNAMLGPFPVTGVTTTLRVTTTPVAITQPVARAPDGTFRLRGLVYPLGLPATAYYEWGPKVPFGSYTPARVLDGSSLEVPIEESLSGLPAGTQFRCRLVISDQRTSSSGAVMTFATPTPGAGTALQFDGLDDWVQVPRGFTNTMRSFTMELWARPTAEIVLPDEATAGVQSATPARFAIYPSEGGTRYGSGHVGVGVSIGTNGVCVYEHGNNYLAPVLVHGVSLETWTHVAVVYRQDAPPALYLNGVPAHTGLRSDFIPHPSVEIGNTGNVISGGRGYFQGELDEVRVWSRPLTAEEILLQAARAMQGNEPGLEACLNLDEGAGVFLLDGTGHGYDGEALNSVTWIPSPAPLGQPLVATLPAEGITGESAMLQALVYPAGVPCQVHFEWGFPEALQHQTPDETLAAAAAPVVIRIPVTGLRPGLTYQFRPVVQAMGESRAGDASTFFTAYASLGGQALQMDGLEDGAHMGTPFGAVTDNFTVEFWARPTASRAATAETNFEVTDLSGQRFVLFPQQGSQAYGSNHATVGVSVGSNGVSVFEHGNIFRPSVLVHQVNLTDWVHVAVVYSARQPRLFLNGVLTREGRASSRILHPSADLGTSTPALGGGQARFQGEVDEVRIWSVARSEEDIRRAMHQKLRGNEDGLLLYYSFDTGPGSSIPSQAATPQSATVQGTPTWVNSGAPVDDGKILDLFGADFAPGQATVVAVVNPGGHPSTAYLEWGSSPNFGMLTPVQALGDGTADMTIRATITGLNPGALYYGRVIMESEGRFVVGSTEPFTAGWPGGGPALWFDGLNDCVTSSVAALASVQNTFTIELWARPEEEIKLLPERSAGGNWPERQRFAVFPTEGVTAYGAGHTGAGLSIGRNGVNVVEHAPSHAPALLSSPADLPGWTHVAVVFDRGQPSLYLNGQLTRTGVASTQTVHPGAFLGASQVDVFQGFYAGSIDEVRIWRTARTGAELRANLHRRLTGEEADLARFWRLDEGAGNHIGNSTSALDEGTRHGATWFPSDIPFGRAWVEEERILNSDREGADLQLRVQGYQTGGRVEVEWGPSPALGSRTSSIAIEPEDVARTIVVHFGGPDDGSVRYYRALLTTAGVTLAGPLGKLVQPTLVQGAALRFDGLDDWVSFPSPGLTQTSGTFTLEFWAWPEAGRDPTAETSAGTALLGSQRFAIYPSHGPSVFGTGWATAGVSVGTNGVSVIEHGDNHWASVLVHHQALQGWTHVAVVYSNAIPQLFVNGSRVRTGFPSGLQVGPGFILGGGPSVLGTAGFFQGQIDQPRLWRHAMTEAEVQTLRRLSSDHPFPGLAWSLTLDEGWGDRIHDAVQPPREGQVQNGATWELSTAPLTRFVAFSLTAGGDFRFQFAAEPSRSFTLERSSDLRDWIPVSTNSASPFGLLDFTQGRPAEPPHQFYRLVPR